MADVVEFEGVVMTAEERELILRVRHLEITPSMIFPWLDRAPLRKPTVWAKITRHAPYGYAAHKRGTVAHVVRTVDMRIVDNQAHFAVEWMCGGSTHRPVLTHEPADHLDSCVRCEEAIERDNGTTETRVYFAQARETGAIKIGFTIDVPRRMRQIRPEVDLLVAVEGGRGLERRMHERFAHLRIAGEWFRPDRELMELISDLAEEAA